MLRTTSRRLNEHLQTLGLNSSRQATAAEIKRAYREQTKIHHPDVGGDPERFKKICASYNILSGKEYHQKVTTDFYSNVRASNPHYEYYYGESRTRDGERSGSEHGKHGADWANQGGANANYSTRDFYRPYESGAGGRTGFTEEEINAARRATHMHRAWRWSKHLFLISGLYMCYCSYRIDRIEDNAKARREGYDREYWEKKQKDAEAGLTTPALDSYWERKKREMADAQVEDAKRRKEMGIRNPFDSSNVPSGPRAVTYRGQPFTPEGLAASRRSRNPPPIPTVIDLDGINDLSFDIEDVEAMAAGRL